MLYQFKEHMPERHQAITLQRGWKPEYYLKKAAENGPNNLAQKVMDSKLIIDQSYTVCLVLLRLMGAYGSHRMEAACERALQGSRFSYGSIKKILENNMDLLEDEHAQTEFLLPRHANLRGSETFK